MAQPATGTAIKIDQTGEENYSLTVIHGGQTFDCGSFISRAAAQQAGRLFVQRKEGEAAGRKKRPRKKQ